MRTLLALLQAASLAGAAAATPPQQPARPNIIVVLVDDLGAGDLSCYGADDLQTPSIDGFVARGMAKCALMVALMEKEERDMEDLEEIT